MANPSQLQAHKIGAPLMNLIKLKGVPIFQQLHLEECLLRTSSHNWCIINQGTNRPTIVMGVSGKPAELLKIESVLCDQIPVVRRFTGGGTVVVDPNTIFVTFICNKDAGLQPYPQPIMSWTGALYNKVFQGIGDFHLRENEGLAGFTSRDWYSSRSNVLMKGFTCYCADYVFGDGKFGGNAQSITKNQWIHHTSFLWDYEVRNMAYLKLPARAPEYRLARGHLEFICRMKDYMSRSEFISRTIEATKTLFSLRSAEAESIETTASVNTKFCPTTRLLTKHELEAAAFASLSLGSLSRSF